MLKHLWENFRELVWPDVSTARGRSLAVYAGVTAAIFISMRISGDLFQYNWTADIVRNLSAATWMIGKLPSVIVKMTWVYLSLVVLCGAFLALRRSRVAAALLMLFSLVAPAYAWFTRVLIDTSPYPGAKQIFLGMVALMALNGCRGAWAHHRKKSSEENPLDAPRGRHRQWPRVMALSLIGLWGAFNIWVFFINSSPMRPDIKSVETFFEECLGRDVPLTQPGSDQRCAEKAIDDHYNERWRQEGRYFGDIRMRLEYGVALPIGIALLIYALLFGLPRREKSADLT